MHPALGFYSSLKDMCPSSCEWLLGVSGPWCSRQETGSTEVSLYGDQLASSQQPASGSDRTRGGNTTRVGARPRANNHLVGAEP